MLKHLSWLRAGLALARGLALGLLLLLAPPRAGRAMEMAIPEEIRNLPPEQRTQWLNQQFAEAAALQKKVAQERFDAREEARAAIIQGINGAAAVRERQIAEAQDALQQNQDEAEQQQSIASSGLLGAMLIACLGAWLYMRRRAESEPVSYT